MSERDSDNIGKIWAIGLGIALLLGVVFRTIWVADMEYKQDERGMFLLTQNTGKTEPWRWLGITSGQGNLPNPGLSTWVFVATAKVFQIDTPTGLARAVMISNCIALLLLAGFAWRCVPKSDRETWLWGAALVALNPISVMYERKIWAQSILPIFCVMFLIAVWHRKSRAGAFAWGVMGAILGQIHMSGFFYAFAFFAWVLLWDRKSVRWPAWLGGSILGAMPLIPWFIHILSNPSGGVPPMRSRWFWEYWITNASGTGLGFAVAPLGSTRYSEVLENFLSFPTIGGYSTWLVGAANVLAITATGIVLLRSAWQIIADFVSGRRNLGQIITGKDNPTALLQQAAILGYGLLLSMTNMLLYRHYLLIAYPIPSIWLARQAMGGNQKISRGLLLTLAITSAVLSAAFLTYIHIHGGAELGEYWISYHRQTQGNQP